MRKTYLRTIDDLFTLLRGPEPNWSQIILVNLDLRSPAVDDALLKEEIDSRTAFLGCVLSGPLARKVAAAGSLVVPARHGLPFNPFRSEVYSASHLLEGFLPGVPESYLRTPDWRCYFAAMDEGTKRKRADLGIDDAIFLRLHDLAIEDALDGYLKPRSAPLTAPKRMVGIMGGHDRERVEKTRDPDEGTLQKDAPYMQVALLAQRLARAGFTVATGGGPGAMEASNLGAWFASRSEGELRDAVRMLERVPKVKPRGPRSQEWNSGEWLGPAFEVMERFPRDVSDPRTESVGVPTWFYGHEPPNPFASHIAKFFENSIREEGVLAIASHGVIFAEGNAGTVQEIFQDACQNYYATYGAAAPMILLGTEYWGRGGAPSDGPSGKSVWPLLRQLAAEKDFGHLLLLTDDLELIVNFLMDPPKSKSSRTTTA